MTLRGRVEIREELGREVPIPRYRASGQRRPDDADAPIVDESFDELDEGIEWRGRAHDGCSSTFRTSPGTACGTSSATVSRVSSLGRKSYQQRPNGSKVMGETRTCPTKLTG
jgi:hypothetical protein